jgi:hypothetical protein
MKKVILAISVLIMVLLTACGKEATSSPVTPNGTNDATTTSSTPAPGKPIVEANFTSPQDKDKLQEPTTVTKELLSELEKGDLSGIAGTYYSVKYGYATITEDGGITFATVTGKDGSVYQNLKYMSFSPEQGNGIGDMKIQGSLPYLYWNVYFISEHSNHTGPDLGYGQELITLFPKGVEIAWRGDNDTADDYMESDISKIRLFIQGSEHGTGTIEDRLDPFAYFIEAEMPDNPPTNQAPQILSLVDFDFFGQIGFTSQQQDEIWTTVEQFFAGNHPEMGSISCVKKSLAYDTTNPDITYCQLLSDTGEIFKIVIDSEGSMFRATVSIYDSNDKLLN